MPPYKPYASRAQEKKLNAMAGRGEISQEEVNGKNRASKGMKLPQRIKGSMKMRKHHFSGASNE